MSSFTTRRWNGENKNLNGVKEQETGKTGLTDSKEGELLCGSQDRVELECTVVPSASGMIASSI